MIEIKVSDTPLAAKDCMNFVSDAAAGGTVVFIGTVRNQTKGRGVVRLEFEAYVPMAEKEMLKIAQQVEKKWDALHVAIHHRVGMLEVGETPVVMAVATPHREAAFKACEYAIDALKETVPIWKREIFGDGAVWVAAHP